MSISPLLLAGLIAAAPLPLSRPHAPARSRGSARPFAHFPEIDQLRERAPDGGLSLNAQMNCVPASIAAALEFLTGRSYSGEAIKAAVYGAAYIGPTQIYRYLAWVRTQGVHMRPVLSHDPQVLVRSLRALLARGVPVVLSVPGDPSRAPLEALHPRGVTHVVVAAGFDASGNIRAMNPWGGTWLTGSDAFWAARICYGELWAMERQAPASPAPPRIRAATVVTQR